MYGGRISSILLNIPGDEPALMTTLDGFPMAKQGRAGEALALSGVASFVGGFFATVDLVLFAPLLAEVALLFGPAEYFALFTLAFATLGGISSRKQAKAAMAAAIGLGIAMIGIDFATGIPRYTFNNIHLFEGIDFLVAIVGLFAISEVLLFLEHRGADTPGRHGARANHGAAQGAAAVHADHGAEHADRVRRGRAARRRRLARELRLLHHRETDRGPRETPSEPATRAASRHRKRATTRPRAVP